MFSLTYEVSALQELGSEWGGGGGGGLGLGLGLVAIG